MFSIFSHQRNTNQNPDERVVHTHYSILAWKISWTEEPGRSHELDVTERLLMMKSGKMVLMNLVENRLVGTVGEGEGGMN